MTCVLAWIDARRSADPPPRRPSIWRRSRDCDCFARLDQVEPVMIADNLVLSRRRRLRAWMGTAGP
jgi:hypothetical protein